jgi:hypothetical protein
MLSQKFSKIILARLHSVIQRRKLFKHKFEYYANLTKEIAEGVAY